MDKEFGGLDCSQIDFNNSSTSTSPALSSTGKLGVQLSLVYSNPRSINLWFDWLIDRLKSIIF